MHTSIEFRDAFKVRTKQFALRTIKRYQALPKTGEAQTIGRQLLRSATSVAANYRAACRSRSGNDFFSKLCIVVEEADETLFWLELLAEAEIVTANPSTALINEATAILKVSAKARKTTQK